MIKNLWKVLFVAPLICLALWTAFLAYQRNTGQEVIVAVQGYDPRDLLSGHYIQYQVDWDKTDCTQFADNVCPQKDFCKDARWGRQCRFYVPEKSAGELDALFNFVRFGQKDLTFEVVYAYKPGQQAIAKQLLINGADWREYPLSEKID